MAKLKLQNYAIEQLLAIDSGITTLFENLFTAGLTDLSVKTDQFDLYSVASLQGEIQILLKSKILNEIGQIKFESRIFEDSE